MAKYNSSVFYNRSQNYGGAKYNAIAYIILFRLSDIIQVSDNKFEYFAQMILSESSKIKDDLISNSHYDFRESFNIKEIDTSVTILFEVLDNIGMKDVAADLFVGMFVKDRIDILEDAKQFAEILASDKIHVEDIVDVDALIKAMDEMGFEELGEIFAKYPIYEQLNATDRDPKTAVSDFYVTKDENGLYDIILPFNLIVDYSRTHIPFMPEAIDTSVNLAGTDGEIVQDTVYGSRIFDIFAVTYDGLEIYEKEEIKRDIANILHSIKNKTKKITFANNETSFDVKYSGLADVTTDAPGWMRFEIPLKSESSYGSKMFEQTLYGSGLMTNGGDEAVGAIITISGEITDPTFEMGAETFKWTGTVPEGKQLIIDMDDQSCYIVDENGIKTLATKNLTGEYIKIPVGSMVLQASQETESHIITKWREKVLY